MHHHAPPRPPVRRPAAPGVVRALLAAALVGAALPLGGCPSAGFSNWPPVDGNWASNNVNAPPFHQVCMTALNWTTRKYPPVENPELGVVYQEPYAINLPAGTSPELYVRTAEQLGGQAQPLTEENTDLPTYHIHTVEIRGTEAWVTVLYPFLNLGAGPDGQRLYRAVRIRLLGGVGDWRVSTHYAYPISVVEVPEPNYYKPRRPPGFSDTPARLPEPEPEPVRRPAPEPMDEPEPMAEPAPPDEPGMPGDPAAPDAAEPQAPESPSGGPGSVRLDRPPRRPE